MSAPESVTDAPTVLRRLSFRDTPGIRIEDYLDREWLVTNGLGGFASGSIGGVPTRSFHGLLTAALPAPLGRALLLGPVMERPQVPDGFHAWLGGLEHPTERLALEDQRHLVEFCLEAGVPVWHYEINGCLIERRLWMPHCFNAVMVRYRLLQGAGPVRLQLHPGVFFRFYDAPVSTPLPTPFQISVVDGCVEVRGAGKFPALRMVVLGGQAKFTIQPSTVRERVLPGRASARLFGLGGDVLPGFVRGRAAPQRAHHFRGDLREPGDAARSCRPEQAEQIEHERRQRLLTLVPPALREGVGAELVLAADQFLMFPATRMEESTRLRAAGDEARSVIAGYHWFTDWGRDTMIGLEGLTLTTGRHAEAGYILRTFVHHVRDGLIPNYFPDGQGRGGLYLHRADADRCGSSTPCSVTWKQPTTTKSSFAWVAAPLDR